MVAESLQLYGSYNYLRRLCAHQRNKLIRPRQQVVKAASCALAHGHQPKSFKMRKAGRCSTPITAIQITAFLYALAAFYLGSRFCKSRRQAQNKIWRDNTLGRKKSSVGAVCSSGSLEIIASSRFQFVRRFYRLLIPSVEPADVCAYRPEMPDNRSLETSQHWPFCDPPRAATQARQNSQAPTRRSRQLRCERVWRWPSIFSAPARTILYMPKFRRRSVVTSQPHRRLSRTSSG